MHRNDRTRHSVTMLLLAIFTMMLASCKTPPPLRGVPEHCITKDEWPSYIAVVMQKWEVHAPGLDEAPTKYRTYAARVSYLEGVCKGINAFRRE